jgi:hypothetical protein
MTVKTGSLLKLICSKSNKNDRPETEEEKEKRKMSKVKEIYCTEKQEAYKINNIE